MRVNVKDCPSCGRESVVKDSRINKATGTIKRRRVCACGRQWRTLEVFEDDAHLFTIADRSRLQAAAMHITKILHRLNGEEEG